MPSPARQQPASLRIARRLAAIAIGFAAAMLAASLFAHVAFALGAAMGSMAQLRELVGPLWASVPMLMVIAAILAIGPAAFAIGCAEYFGIRRWTYFALAGVVGGLVVLVAVAGISGTIGTLLALLSGEGLPQGVDPLMSVLTIAASALSAVVYWAIAGRGSGRWLATAPAPSGS